MDHRSSDHQLAGDPESSARDDDGNYIDQGMPMLLVLQTSRLAHLSQSSPTCSRKLYKWSGQRLKWSQHT